MLQTIQAEVQVNGTVRWLEPLHVAKATRALVTLLDHSVPSEPETGNATALLELLCSPAFAQRRSYDRAEIEARIEENRNAWE
jgi:hypothetical protein